MFSGRNAPYDEAAPHDAVGVYARSKSLGEPRSPNCVTLRCSIIGPEKAPAKSLLGMILSQPPGAVITGHTNHHWNGVTTLHLARLCAAVIQDHAGSFPPVQHVVPGDAVSKAELIGLCIQAFGRNDLILSSRSRRPSRWTGHFGQCTQRSIERLWAAAGHAVPPTIGEMVKELAAMCDH